MFAVMVTHQLIGHHPDRPFATDSRSSAAAMIATLRSTLAAESHRGGAARKTLAEAAGSSAMDPMRQTQPRSRQYPLRAEAARPIQDTPS